MSSARLAPEEAIALPFSPVTIPRLGFGVYQIPAKKTASACLEALEAGFRHIDTAQLYRNEAEVGQALRQTAVDRADVFVTTKVGQRKETVEATYKSVTDSVAKIGGEDGYVDLFLVHTPMFGYDTRKELWLALERLLKEERTKSIGVSNYGVKELEEMKEYATVWPPHVNQIELHPWCQQREVVDYCNRHGIVVQAYSPLVQGEKMTDPTLCAIADKHSKSPAQVLIRYSFQNGWVSLPKSVTPERIRENAAVFGWMLDEEDMKTLDGLEGGRGGARFPKNIS